MTRTIRRFVAEAKRDLAENRASQVLVVVLAVMVVGLAVLAAGGNEFGIRGLSFVTGGLAGGLAVAVAAQTPGLRKTALVLGVAALPAWILFGILSAVLPGPGWLHALFAAYGPDSSNAAAVAVQGFVMCAAIQGMIGLFGPNRPH